MLNLLIVATLSTPAWTADHKIELKTPKDICLKLLQSKLKGLNAMVIEGVSSLASRTKPVKEITRRLNGGAILHNEHLRDGKPQSLVRSTWEALDFDVEIIGPQPVRPPGPLKLFGNHPVSGLEPFPVPEVLDLGPDEFKFVANRVFGDLSEDLGKEMFLVTPKAGEFKAGQSGKVSKTAEANRAARAAELEHVNNGGVSMALAAGASSHRFNPKMHRHIGGAGAGNLGDHALGRYVDQAWEPGQGDFVLKMVDEQGNPHGHVMLVNTLEEPDEVTVRAINEWGKGKHNGKLLDRLKARALKPLGEQAGLVGYVQDLSKPRDSLKQAYSRAIPVADLHRIAVRTSNSEAKGNAEAIITTLRVKTYMLGRPQTQAMQPEVRYLLSKGLNRKEFTSNVVPAEAEYLDQIIKACENQFNCILAAAEVLNDGPIPPSKRAGILPVHSSTEEAGRTLVRSEFRRKPYPLLDIDSGGYDTFFGDVTTPHILGPKMSEPKNDLSERFPAFLGQTQFPYIRPEKTLDTPSPDLFDPDVVKPVRVISAGSRRSDPDASEVARSVSSVPILGSISRIRPRVVGNPNTTQAQVPYGVIHRDVTGPAALEIPTPYGGRVSIVGNPNTTRTKVPYSVIDHEVHHINPPKYPRDFDPVVNISREPISELNTAYKVRGVPNSLEAAIARAKVGAASYTPPIKETYTRKTSGQTQGKAMRRLVGEGKVLLTGKGVFLTHGAQLRGKAGKPIRQAIGEARQEAFVRVNEGTAHLRDWVTRYDGRYFHTGVFDKDRGVIAGTRIRRYTGKPSEMYLDTLGEFHPAFFSGTTELGRTFVSPDSGMRTLPKLFSGIVETLLREARGHFRLVGPLTIGSDYSEEVRYLIAKGLISKGHDRAKQIRMPNPFKPSKDLDTEALDKILESCAGDRTCVLNAASEIHQGPEGLPPLFNFYLDLGAEFLAEGTDPNFKGALDIVMQLDFEKAVRKMAFNEDGTPNEQGRRKMKLLLSGNTELRDRLIEKFSK